MKAYTRDQLLKRLESRHGIHIKPRKFRDLVDEQLLPPGKPEGLRRGVSPRWTWDRDTYKRLLRIDRLRTFDITGYDSVCIELWFRGSEIPIQRVRRATANEFAKLKRKLLNPLKSDAGPKGIEVTDRSRANRIAKRFGDAAPQLLPIDFQYERSRLVAVIDAFRFNEQFQGANDFFDKVSIDWGISSFLKQFFVEFSESSLPLKFSKLFGSLGHETDDLETLPGSIEACIFNVPDGTYRLARDLYRSINWLLSNADDFIPSDSSVTLRFRPLIETVHSLLKWEPLPWWQFALFVVLLHVEADSAVAANYESNLVWRAIIAIQRMKARCRRDPSIGLMAGSNDPYAAMSSMCARTAIGHKSYNEFRFPIARRLWRFGLSDFLESRRRIRMLIAGGPLWTDTVTAD